jgi:MinD-like ATPase involved in chromosome partitioning or flagellar assembly
MALVALASAKGAPGVTTAALVLGALWPREVLVADCDPAGGDVANRMPAPDGRPLDVDRGLLSLAAVARHGLEPEQLMEQVQTVVGGLRVLVGVRTPEQAAALGPLWPALGPCLDRLAGTDVIADCGRLTNAPGQLDVVKHARFLVLLCTPTVSGLLHLRERLPVLEERLRSAAPDGVPVGVVVVSNEARDVAGVAEALGRQQTSARILGRLPYDPKGAEFFAGRLEGRVERTALVRGARDVAADVAGLVGAA